uniref:Leucine-rich repeat-containing N-terminal plant-type domain-containing protein n=1 Tax=Paramoeba aestuarina TaxID=180227 RepID=A0A7S4U7C4_9EUKA|mmetsp:Transcript_40214/g.63631  ORF Transcript_40214/g.63631 Transcript_40214/m.63631 type:complete len:216 (+) Transcript_40214:21-668(+)
MILFSVLVNTSENTAETDLQFRDILMEIFFHHICPRYIEDISINSAGQSVCGWTGVNCCGDDVIGVQYQGINWVGNFNIYALPSTTTMIWITSSSQSFPMITRRFPRKLTSISLTVNEIFGTLDLTTLPSQMTDGYFNNNRLVGPLNFIRLPRTLQRLNVVQNNIQQKRVWYDSLPKNLRTILLANVFGEVRAIDPRQMSNAKKIFRGVTYDKIH